MKESIKALIELTQDPMRSHVSESRLIMYESLVSQIEAKLNEPPLRYFFVAYTAANAINQSRGNLIFSTSNYPANWEIKKWAAEKLTGSTLIESDVVVNNIIELSEADFTRLTSKKPDNQ